MLIDSRTDPWIQMDNGICVVLGFLGSHDGSNELWYSIDPATRYVYKLTDFAARHLLSTPRLPFTGAYFGSIAMTLYFSLGVSIPLHAFFHLLTPTSSTANY